jgi:hypothetical protein
MPSMACARCDGCPCDECWHPNASPSSVLRTGQPAQPGRAMRGARRRLYTLRNRCFRAARRCYGARIAGGPCRTVLIRAMAEVGCVIEPARRRRCGDPRSPSPPAISRKRITPRSAPGTRRSAPSPWLWREPAPTEIPPRSTGTQCSGQQALPRARMSRRGSLDTSHRRTVPAWTVAGVGSAERSELVPTLWQSARGEGE